MSETKNGSIGWIDLTVPDAASLKGFYERVPAGALNQSTWMLLRLLMHPAGGDKPLPGFATRVGAMRICLRNG